MSRHRTLTAMLTDIRQRTNMENSTFVTDAELTEYLNQELAELHGRLVYNQGQPLIRSQTTINVVSPTAVYSLPADFLAVQEVTATVNGVTGNIRPFMMSEHGLLTSPGAVLPYLPVMYRVQGNNIEFRPATQSFTATLYYTPSCPRLVNPADTFDGYNGWEMAAIYGACAIVAAKEETDMAAFHEQRKAGIVQQIEKLAAHRDMSMPERIQDVRDDGTEWIQGGPLGWWL